MIDGGSGFHSLYVTPHGDLISIYDAAGMPALDWEGMVNVFSSQRQLTELLAVVMMLGLFAGTVTGLGTWIVNMTRAPGAAWGIAILLGWTVGVMALMFAGLIYPAPDPARYVVLDGGLGALAVTIVNPWSMPMLMMGMLGMHLYANYSNNAPTSSPPSSPTGPRRPRVP